MKKERSKDAKINLGAQKVSKLIMSFFCTSLIGLALSSVYNLTDALFISWGVGDLAMGGVSIIAPFIFLQSAISTMLGGGAAALISLKIGKGEYNQAGKITVNAMVVFYSVALTISVLGLVFINPLLRFMGAGEEIFAYAKDYFIIILIGNVVSTGFSSIMRAEGKNLYSMITWMTTIVVNIVLDAVFILVFKWGVKGAGLATVIGQICGVTLSIIYFLKVSNMKYKGAKLEWKTIAEILKIGAPSLAQMGGFTIIFGIFNIVLSKLDGANGIITFGYISKLLMFAVAPFMAMTQALAPIVGYNYGNGDLKRVNQGVKFSIAVAMAYALAVIVAILFLAKFMIMIFTKDSHIIALGATGLRILSLAFVFVPLPMLIGAKMQAIGKKVWALVLNGSNVLFIILPAVLLGKRYGVNGLMIAFVIAYFLSTLLAVINLLYYRNQKLLNKKNQM